MLALVFFIFVEFKKIPSSIYHLPCSRALLFYFLFLLNFLFWSLSAWLGLYWGWPKLLSLSRLLGSNSPLLELWGISLHIRSGLVSSFLFSAWCLSIVSVPVPWLLFSLWFWSWCCLLHLSIHSWIFLSLSHHVRVFNWSESVWASSSSQNGLRGMRPSGLICM